MQLSAVCTVTHLTFNLPTQLSVLCNATHIGSLKLLPIFAENGIIVHDHHEEFDRVECYKPASTHNPDNALFWLKQANKMRKCESKKLGCLGLVHTSTAWSIPLYNMIGVTQNKWQLNEWNENICAYRIRSIRRCSSYLFQSILWLLFKSCIYLTQQKIFCKYMYRGHGVL